MSLVVGGVPIASLLMLAVSLAIATFVHRPLLGRLGAGTIQHLVRLPGNLLHELAHAVAMMATGFTVADLRVSLLDPAGRGHVRPGPPWIGVARPWLTNLVSPVAPVFVAVAALATLHATCAIPGLPSSPAGILPVLRAVDPARWELWVGLALGYSVTAEMAPSDIDLAAWWRPALVAAVFLAAAAYGLEALAPGTVRGGLVSADLAARGILGRTLAVVVWSGLTCAPLAFLAGRLRG
ncbi:MAG: hypothetical protein Q8P18_30895 [Pseudomonadota bacterium]|nr:hypothetical protein [Pseudomonadota bacterium]